MSRDAPDDVRYLPDSVACSLHVELSVRHVNLNEEAVDVVLLVGPTLDDTLFVRPMGLAFARLPDSTTRAGKAAQGVCAKRT